MTLNELRYLVAVARERHFGRAAQKCHVSQPTLSVAIKKLEDDLGVVLFERARNDVTPTPVGQQVIEQATQVLEQLEQLRHLAQQGKDQLKGPIRVGAIYTIGPYLFPSLVENLHESAPDMPLLIEENYTARLTERLKQGELDAAIISLPYEQPGIVTLPLYDEPFVVVLPSSHPLTAQSEISNSDLAQESVLLLGAGNCFRDQVIEACPECLHSGQAGAAQTLEGGSLETIRHMVASGIGITVLPVTAVGADRFSQRLISIRRFAQPEPQRRVALAWRVSFPRSKAIDKLLTAIRDASLSGVRLVKDT